MLDPRKDAKFTVVTAAVPGRSVPPVHVIVWAALVERVTLITIPSSVVTVGAASVIASTPAVVTTYVPVTCAGIASVPPDSTIGESLPASAAILPAVTEKFAPERSIGSKSVLWAGVPEVN